MIDMHHTFLIRPPSTHVPAPRRMACVVVHLLEFARVSTAESTSHQHWRKLLSGSERASRRDIAQKTHPSHRPTAAQLCLAAAPLPLLSHEL